MGEEHAAAVMEWVPDGPLASKADIEQQFAHSREIMDLRFAALREALAQRFEMMATVTSVSDLRAEMHSTIRLHTIVLVGALGTMISLARIF
jgi:hypothetical protein